ncbi:MAG: hypothetical protein HOG12_07890 [Alphaproteobacteria bacterium]|jgi:hypothetical protein|nr:hypothetical protein [Alphaproteobacteria bacterium]
MTKSEIEATAFHEAGHAVMAWLCARNIGKVTIEPVDDEAGSVSHAEYGESAVGLPIFGDGEEGLYVIMPDESPRPLSDIERWLYEFSYKLEWEAEEWEKQALIAFAGEAVDLITAPESFHPGTVASDRASFDEAISEGDGNAEVIHEWAKSIFTEPTIWKSVSALADKLISQGTLSGNDTLKLLRAVALDGGVV